ncbi:MAG: NADH-quinone oxidoreductase subunit NuoH [SAR324 cluster bacterium]|nr:NADH-quinone oxidoreductase subunit NuoH [SAR324 cluster bacterium]
MNILDLLSIPILNISSSGWETITIAQRAADALSGNSIELTIFFLILCILITVSMLAGLGMVLIYAERKIAGHFQCRLGPMRVGWHGTLQAFADVLKLLLKEDLVPARADKLLHLGAPFLSILATVLGLAIIPMSPSIQVIDVNIGVVYVTAITGLGVLGALIAGWSSNNKWSLLGAMRAGAQLISYELSATLGILVIVLFAGSLQLSEIIQSQAEGWWIWRAHIVGIIAFFIFLIASTAELNRTPFDLPEGESELTGGFHTEYSGLRFAFFFLSEFVNMFVASALVVTLFFGGWMPFHIGNWEAFNSIMDLIPPAIWFAGKSAFFIFLLMWFRWTFPRMRIDQLMRLEWKILLPIGFANIFLASLVILTKFHF